jgi:ABC-type phosphate/phosphonate transport system substrate-binding protein
MLLDAGVDLDRLDCRYFSYHDRAARAVQVGEVEACGVRDTVASAFAERGLRVLAQSEEIPNSPLVAVPSRLQEARALLISALIDLPARNPEAARELRLLDEELRAGFHRCADSQFDGLRGLAARVFGANALTVEPAALRCGSGSR